MPRYEYRCRTCGDTVKLLSTVAVGGSATAPAPASAPRAGGGGGGCCGGG